MVFCGFWCLEILSLTLDLLGFGETVGSVCVFVSVCVIGAFACTLEIGSDDHLANSRVHKKHVSVAMESDLKRSDASRKSFRLPAKSRQAPAPPNSSANIVHSATAATTPIRLYNTSMSPSQPSAVDKTVVAPATATVAVGMRLKTFGPGGCVGGNDPYQKPLKLADILKPNNDCIAVAAANNNNNNNNKPLHGLNAMEAPKSPGVETSLEVLKDLEKRINRIEMNEKLKQSINGRKLTGTDGNAVGGKLVQIKNQYADRENLTKAGLDSASTSSAGLDQSDENDSSFFQRNSDGRSSIGATIALKAIIDAKPSNGDGAFSSTKPVSRTVSDTKSVENSVRKLRISYMQKQLGQQHIQKQQNHATAAMVVVNSREHISSFAGSKSGPLSPLTSKKKENTIVVDKTKLTTSTAADSSRNTNTSKLSHSSSLKRETLRHPITPTTATTTTTPTTPTSVKLNKKHQQVIWDSLYSLFCRCRHQKCTRISVAICAQNTQQKREGRER